MPQIKVKVMKNFTICIPKEIREKMSIKISDMLIISSQNDQIVIQKTPSFEDLAGIGKKTFKKLGGGETYLQQERDSWDI